MRGEENMPDEQKSQGKRGRRTDTRGRVFAFIVYQDSAPENWIEKLKEQHVRGFISPAHDRDVLADGSQKKSHWHVMLYFDGKKSREQIDAIREKALGEDFNKGLEEVVTPGAYARYLCHLDDTDKAQYSRNDVIEMGGADYDLAASSAGDETVIMSEISAYVVVRDITSVNTLIRYCKEEARRDWLAYISRHGYVVGMMIGHNAKRLERIRNGVALAGDFADMSCASDSKE